LGATVAELLFGDQDPIGAVVRIKKIPFKVIGVLARKGGAVTGTDQDDLVVAPYTTVQKKILGVTYIGAILASAASPEAIAEATEEITALLHQRHHIQPGQDDDFSLRTQMEIASAQESATRTMTILLASIASVSLIVGGIGIMNIMLVSVTERTREIGLRMAWAAQPGRAFASSRRGHRSQRIRRHYRHHSRHRRLQRDFNFRTMGDASVTQLHLAGVLFLRRRGRVLRPLSGAESLAIGSHRGIAV
jgi:hypothetical protein